MKLIQTTASKHFQLKKRKMKGDQNLRGESMTQLKTVG